MTLPQSTYLSPLRSLHVFNETALSSNGSLMFPLAAYPYLESLRIESCNLTGTIPSWWAPPPASAMPPPAGSPRALRQLRLTGNALNGTLPPWLNQLFKSSATLDDDVELDLSSNNFTGGVGGGPC